MGNLVWDKRMQTLILHRNRLRRYRTKILLKLLLERTTILLERPLMSGSYGMITTGIYNFLSSC